jgi:MFS family permease
MGTHPDQVAEIARERSRALAGEAAARRSRRGPGSRRRSLWRHPDFVRLWSAETVSRFGSQISLLALPLLAITVLHASTFEVGLLTTMEFLPFVLVGLPAGVWVDRLRRRPVLIAGDLGRAVALASIPFAHLLGVLGMPQLYVVALVTGVLTVFFDVAYQSYLPRLVDADQLIEGNAKLEVSSSGASIAGPGLAGVLIQLITAPLAVLADAASFVASAAFIGRIRREEPAPAPASAQTGMRLEIAEGLRFVLGHPLLRWIAACTGTFNLFSSMLQAVLVVYEVRHFGMSAGLIGVTMTVGNLGWLGGAMLSGWLGRRIGVGRATVAAVVLGGIGPLMVALAPLDNPVPWLIGANLVISWGTTTYNIGQLSIRQAITPERLHGRMNASMRFMVWGTLPIGSAIGGALGQAIGLHPTIWVAAIGSVVPLAPGLASGIWSVPSVEAAVARFPPAPAPVQAGAAGAVEHAGTAR